MIRLQYLFMGMAFSLTMLMGCLPEDEPVAPFDRGSVELAQVEMDPSYRYQVFFDLSAGSVTGEVDKLNWDLRIDRNEGFPVIRLNSSKLMVAARTSTTDMASLTDRNGLSFSFDPSTGATPTAISGWEDGGVSFVVDRGFNTQGQLLGDVKLQLEQLSEDRLALSWADLSATDVQNLVLELENERTYYSFSNGGQVVSIEPDLDWDLIFTQYTTGLFDGADTIPYLVTGVLLHPKGISAARDTLYDFADITREVAVTMVLTEISDVIGYDWKEFDFDQGLFTIDEGVNYILRDAEGFYFKLRFRDFYNDQGEKGAPLFEYQLL